jgi:outer membrane receptor protein involved in Fe transport
MIANVAGSLVLSSSLAMAQAVRQDTPEAQNTTGTSVTVVTQNQVPPPIDDDIIMMSPFQVDSTREKGYFAENTLAGSRMRTNIADLGAAISVVTKQQMEDTASLDMNDIFRYELGTEGSTTYTPDARNPRRPGALLESIGGNTIDGALSPQTNATSNRVRGIGAPSIAINYYSALSLVPFDSYNATSVEISRGPNSMLFGMGKPAGIVNMSTAQAEIGKNNARAQIRIDDRGSERASLSFNKTLIEGKLAIYGALLYNDQQFKRKPSYDITRRQYGAITYKPFKRTKLTASIEGHNNDNRRPNSLTPTDYVSEWRAAGSIVYDAKTHEFRSLQTGGAVVGMYAHNENSPWAAVVKQYIQDRVDSGELDSEKWDASKNQYNGIGIFGANALNTVNSALYMYGATVHTGRPILQIADGSFQRGFQVLGTVNPGTGAWGATDRNPFSTSTSNDDYIYKKDRSWSDIYDWYQVETGVWSQTVNPQVNGTYYYPGVTDSSIYDWRHVNTISMNFGNQRNTNYNIELEQEILPGLLHFSAGWFRQDFDSMVSYNVGSLDSVNLYVDTNVYNSDGTLNPYLGRPYVRDEQPDRMYNSWTVDQYRAMLAFTPDFTKKNNWMKWLGRHQIMGLASYMESENTMVRRRLVFSGSDEMEGLYRLGADPRSPTWMIQAGTGPRRHFYLDTGGTTVGNGAVTQASGGMDDDPVNVPIRVYDYATGTFKDINMTATWNAFNASTAIEARKLTSLSAGWTGYLWEDRIIATAGIRRDKNRTRLTKSVGNNEEGYYENGYLLIDKAFSRWTDWSPLEGTTSTKGMVVKPFLHWEHIAKRSKDSLFWEFVENLGFSYNQSDNFDAPSGTYVDPFGNVLPKSEGAGKDYGVQVSLFKGKLYARLNWFESDSKNEISATADILDRLTGHIDTTAFRGWLQYIGMLNQGGNPTDENWTAKWTSNQSGYEQEAYDKLRADVGDWWVQGVAKSKTGMAGYDYYSTGNLGGSIRRTLGTTSKGMELVVNYNPLPNWTIKLTATKVKTTNADATKEVDAWLAVRKPVWDAARGEDYLNATAKATLNSIGGIGSFRVSSNESDETRGNLTTFWESTNFGKSEVRTSNTDGSTTVLGYYNNVFDSQYTVTKDLNNKQVPGQRKYNFNLITNYSFDRGLLKGWAIGGAQRWADKAIIGYWGKDTDVDTDLLPDASDITRPIYDKAMWYTDLWVSYTRKVFNDKVRMKIQLNVADAFQDGGLQCIAKDWNNNAYAYRIVDSRQFILSATFDF